MMRRVGVILAALAATPGWAMQAGPTPMVAAADDTVYRLDAGDRLRITVLNEDTITGEYEVSGSGMLSLPLIGTVPARGNSLAQEITLIEDKLRDGFLKQPSVAVEVVNYRPFYVLGEVKAPGKYPYVSGMTALNAIALAGGYTYRGKTKRVLVIRAGDPQRREQDLPPTTTVMPGDIVRVPERVF